MFFRCILFRKNNFSIQISVSNEIKLKMETCRVILEFIAQLLELLHHSNDKRSKVTYFVINDLIKNLSSSEIRITFLQPMSNLKQCYYHCFKIFLRKTIQIRDKSRAGHCNRSGVLSCSPEQDDSKIFVLSCERQDQGCQLFEFRMEYIEGTKSV